MSERSRRRIPGSIWLVWLAAIAGSGCKPAPGQADKILPAKVEKTGKESDLNRIVLTPEAERRLGIKTSLVERQVVRRTRTLGGEVLVRPGATVTLSAPFAGRLLPASTFEGGEAREGVPLDLAAGQSVSRDHMVFGIEPLLSSEGRSSLLASLAEAEASLEAALILDGAARPALERAQKLLEDKVGSQRAVDEARATFEGSAAALKAAKIKRDLFAKRLIGTESGVDPSLRIEIPSPVDGILTRLHAIPGQLVSAGAPLVEIVDRSRLWIRVPVYAGALDTIETDAECRVGNPGEALDAHTQIAYPVEAPPTADALATTVDLYYELRVAEERGLKPAEGMPATDGWKRAKVRFTPGQRVAVTLPLRSGESGLVVPWSSVVLDIHGGSWVYEESAPRSYVRRRVQVRFVNDALCTLASGPEPGAKVVTEGAAELFGTEFGVGK